MVCGELSEIGKKNIDILLNLLRLDSWMVTITAYISIVRIMRYDSTDNTTLGTFDIRQGRHVPRFARTSIIRLNKASLIIHPCILHKLL